jgi:GAF domain-containing protein
MDELDLISHLYVQLTQLHGSLEPARVVAAVHETLINLVGSEDFALYLRDGGTGRYEPLSSLGAEGDAFTVGDGARGRAVEAGAIVYGDYAPVVLIPLRARDGILGLIEVRSLLPHKGSLHPRDRALFELFATHAGLALEGALCAEQAHPRIAVAELRARLGQLLPPPPAALDVPRLRP